jgi:hypothetical protein
MHKYTALDRYKARIVNGNLEEFIEDVQAIYTGEMTYDRLALRWGILNKQGLPVRKLAWELARSLVDVVIVAKRETLEDYELRLSAARESLEAESVTVNNLRRGRSNVLPFEPHSR